MATYGNTLVGTGNQNIGSQVVRNNNGTFPENGTCTSLTGTFNTINGTTRRVLMFLLDSSDNLIGVTNLSTQTSTGDIEITLDLVTPVALVLGEVYKHGAWGEDSVCRIKRETVTDAAQFSAAGTFPTVDDPFVTDGNLARDLSLYLNYTPASASPTVTGPADIVDLTPVVLAVTNGAVITTAGFKSGAYKVTNTIDAQTATTLDITPDLGTPTPTTPVASMPTTPDVVAAGTTPYVLKSWVNDGTNPDGEFTLTSLSAGDNTTCVQVMIATSNVTEGESLLAPSIWPTPEDDFQYYGPTVKDGVTITYNADGTVSAVPANQVTVPLVGWSKATGLRSLASVTITGTVITPGNLSIKSGIKFSIKRSILQ
jgi:hypothetical protein